MVRHRSELELYPRTDEWPIIIDCTSVLVKYRDHPKNSAIRAIMMDYDTPAFAIITLKSKGIATMLPKLMLTLPASKSTSAGHRRAAF